MATAYGGPEVLSIADEPTPEPGPGEARIEVPAAGSCRAESPEESTVI